MRDWFRATFHEPSPCQRDAWPAIAAGRHTLIAAPTGAGKTLAAFLAAIDALVRQRVAGVLAEETRVLYVSPLKALGNDIERNLQGPLEGIGRRLAACTPGGGAIRAMVRSGDTPQSARAAMRRNPPHILVTTPESLYILLTSDGGRDILRTVRTVIVDEIHAVAGTKRGAHLALSLERLDALAVKRTVRIGLSATQHPIEIVARFLTGADAGGECTILDSGHDRARDLGIEMPGSPLEAVVSGEIWSEIHDRLARLIAEHRTTLVFVNTRRLVERVTRALSERLGNAHVASHHGSLSREQRHGAEQQLKSGELRALVATASLELGIDIGEVDLVCQIGATRSITTFVQRVGRSGHALSGTPKGRLFPLSRDELVECVALIEATRRGELDRLCTPAQPLDVLAQQMVAMVACEEWHEEALYARVRMAYPYRALSREAFDAVVRMLSEGFATRRGRRSAYLHRDAVNARLRARRGARLTALTCGGAIPDNADYDVILEPQGTFLGSLNEDFAIESLPGDIFQLGNSSWRILRIEAGKVRVADAAGQPPTIPFWLGEAPGRSDELSNAVSRLRERLDRQLAPEPGESAAEARVRSMRWLTDSLALAPPAAQQLVEYLAAARAALGVLPSKRVIVIERFFDETGGMQLVIHSSFGSRVNRAFGLALRKRFCRKFNFELQAAATEDAIVLSLGETHSFALEDVAAYLRAASVREVLTQALLDAPMFTVRWRWNAGISLAVPRFRGGRKVPPALQRIYAEDLVAVVFPDQIACLENVAGKREVPDHPLVEQTIADTLHEVMDIDGLEALLARRERGDVRVVGRDLTEPSPLAREILNAKPYAFLDDAPLEERRTRAVLSRRWLDPASAADIGRLDEAAIARVREEAWPSAATSDELHDALLVLGFITEAEGERAAGWPNHFETLAGERRAARLHLATGAILWVAAERLVEIALAWPAARLEPAIGPPPGARSVACDADGAFTELIRARLGGLGPVRAAALAIPGALPVSQVERSLAALENEGFALRGQFTLGADMLEWCERRLLARIHRYTVQQLRREIEPVSCADFMRFLFAWHGLAHCEPMEGAGALAGVVDQLQGFELPALAWEGDILPARVGDYDPAWLDALCLSGRYVWLRLSTPTAPNGRNGARLRTAPITLVARQRLAQWLAFAPAEPAALSRVSSSASRVATALRDHGASFFDDLASATGLLRTQVEEGLAELAGAGIATSDSFAGLRSLLVPSNRRKPFPSRRRVRSMARIGVSETGRWVLLERHENRGPVGEPCARALPGDGAEALAWQLLRRYGVVFKRLLARETAVAPWRDLVAVLRRLEARGEIRGGRFVAGMSGEQYALPDAIGKLRALRRRPAASELVSLCGADPLNLMGIVTPGPRLPALSGNRVLYRDGVPIAVHAGKAVNFLHDIDPATQWDTRNALLRKRMPSTLRDAPSRAQ